MTRSAVLDLPDVSGVYLFKKNDQILYVGKAKSLRKRVASYFNKQHTDWKIDALIKEHTHITHIVTHTEVEAQLLEAQLIKQYQPKYNVLLKSGQPFVYLLFTKELLPQFKLVRNKKEKGAYFGPFIHKQKARAAFNYVCETFRLYLCNVKIKGGCLHYHLGLCAGTCLEEFDRAGYLFRLELAQKLLSGKYQDSLAALQAHIKQYITEMAFEKARNLHYYVQNLETIFHTLQTKFSEDRYATQTFLATAPSPLLALSAQETAEELQKLLQLETPPHTIDCFDISHFQSQHIVGACVRFTNGMPDKNKFRRFKVTSIAQQDDYSALQEIVQRRYRNREDLPDVVLIDGGKGQLNAVKAVLDHPAIISIAKREERIFSDRFPDGILLDQHSKTGKLLISLRDYAHHFAITYHHMRRTREIN